MIQNNMVRFTPKDVDDVPPGIVFALKGLWQGRNKHLQELMKKDPKKDPKKNAVGKR